jgi:hypothetical protein
MQPKLLSRDVFRGSVFARDGHNCVFCDRHAVDAHHILERRLWTDGGYYIDNGVSVCAEHHLACEMTTISVEDVRHAAGITKIVVPEHFYPDHIYDKWGNPVLEDGRRGKGELFFDESVQKVLGQGGVLGLFTDYVKYGRTFHLPNSPGIHDDDKALKDYSNFEGRRVIISKKMDGENTSGYSDGHVHARSIDSRGGEDRAWVKQFLSTVLYNLPEGWRICGENLWAEHSIHYHNLPSYFLGFSLWNGRGVCLSWDETEEYFDLLGVNPVQVVYDGTFNIKDLETAIKGLDTNTDEGLVVRVADSFSYRDFKSSIAKWVRAGHVQTVSHWRHAQLKPNQLKDKNAT